MRLRILGSSSKGNCYFLENDKEILMIECGVNIDKIKQALNFSISKVAGCLLTHEHMDHAKSAIEIAKLGINVHTSLGTATGINLGYYGHRFRRLIAGEISSVGSFKVLPFAIEHDCKEPLGFVINHEECGNVLFITDSFYVKDTFKNIHNIIIEANYCQEILNEKVAKGASPEFLRSRIFKSHMNIETCKKTLLANDLTRVKNIVLIHLSDHHSDAQRFKKEVEEVTGKMVHVADAGVVIENFNKTVF